MLLIDFSDVTFCGILFMVNNAWIAYDNRMVRYVNIDKGVRCYQYIIPYSHIPYNACVCPYSHPIAYLRHAHPFPGRVPPNGDPMRNIYLLTPHHTSINYDSSMVSNYQPSANLHILINAHACP